MNANVRPAKHAWLEFDQIDVPDSVYDASVVSALIKSIREIRLQSPLTVIERDGRYRLIAGRHRLEALRVLGQDKAPADKVPVRIVDMDEIEARLWTISENLHRRELGALQQAELVAEWIKLTEAKHVSRQPDAKPLGGRPESGTRLASRELGISEPRARRAQVIASLPSEVKAVAIERGLDDNQSALLEASKAPTVEAQVEVLERRADRTPQPERVKPLYDLKYLAAGELARWIKITTPDDRTHVTRMLRECADILDHETDDNDDWLTEEPTDRIAKRN
jgi:ParB-like chromosome segregation protein Spo0J